MIGTAVATVTTVSGCGAGSVVVDARSSVTASVVVDPATNDDESVDVVLFVVKSRESPGSKPVVHRHPRHVLRLRGAGVESAAVAVAISATVSAAAPSSAKARRPLPNRTGISTSRYETSAAINVAAITVSGCQSVSSNSGQWNK